jgi:hypothetical protein
MLRVSRPLLADEPPVVPANAPIDGCLRHYAARPAWQLERPRFSRYCWW